MTSTKVKDSVARPVRTFAQLAPAFVITEFWDSFITDLTEKQYGALVGLLTLILAAIQIAVENKIGKAFLRRMPPGSTEVIDTNPNGATS